MNRYYRSRDGAWYTVIDREFKIPVSQSRYREQADLIVTALNDQEYQNVAAKHTSELIKSTTAVDASGVLIGKCEHGKPFNFQCEDCRHEPDEP